VRRGSEGKGQPVTTGGRRGEGGVRSTAVFTLKSAGREKSLKGKDGSDKKEGDAWSKVIAKKTKKGKQ